MEPRGKLAYIEEDKKITTSGVTTYRNLRSTVVRSVVAQDFSADGLGDEAEFLNDIRVEGVAAHELAHLAGAQDKAYFVVGPDNPHKIVEIQVVGPTLVDWLDMNKGNYFEEGFASLVGSMYAWDKLPGLMQINKTTSYKSPSGARIHMPDRINLIKLTA